MDAHGLPIAISNSNEKETMMTRSFITWGPQPELGCIRALIERELSKIVAHRPPNPLHVQLSANLMLIQSFCIRAEALIYDFVHAEKSSSFWQFMSRNNLFLLLIIVVF